MMVLPFICMDKNIHCVRQAGAGGWSWNGVKEKYCWAG